MELKYIVTIIIKILISVPAIVLITSSKAHGAALMGGHLNNNSNSTSTNYTSNSYELDFDNNHRLSANASAWELSESNTPGYEKNKEPQFRDSQDYELEARTEDEEIPDPSPLVLPGYNLPENIFNKGKPFYLEKDPLTGQVDFDSKSSLSSVDEDEYDYVDEPSPNIYDKANIDRKDGNLGSHKPSDVNQLTPNFHDFLNLPVKYNPDKYVYPLISSSYANTKVQGNINKYYNHKNFAITTYKPTVSPTYYTRKTPYFNPDEQKSTQRITTTTTTTTTTTARPAITKPAPELVYITTKTPNLMDGAMNYPTFADFTTQKQKPTEIYLTTRSPNDVYLTTKRFSVPTTTKRTLSLFEQIFGEYDEIPVTEATVKAPSLFQNLPNNKKKNQYEYEDISRTETPEKNKITNDKDYQNVLSGSAMGHEAAYEYEDDYGNTAGISENNAVFQTKPIKFEIRPTAPSSSSTTTFTTSTTTARPTTTSTTTKRITTTTIPSTTTTFRTTTTTANPSTNYEPSMPENYDYDTEFEENETFRPEHNKKAQPTPTAFTPTKVTSLPLGENHFSTPNLHSPIIAVTHKLKEQLNNEKVPKPFSHQPVASSSSIRIPSNQDTVSFVVGHQQSVGGGFIGSAFKEGPYDNGPFRPLIIDASSGAGTVSYTVQAKPEFANPNPIFSQNFPEPPPQLQQKTPEVGGSSINIQPIKTSEASLSIGVPINGVKKIPGQVVDENLDNEKIEFPKQGIGAKIVFPDEKEDKPPSTFTPDLVPPPLPPSLPNQPIPPPNREVLQLNSKPMYHQLPSDLTPPSEQEIPLTHLERPRPPWDPRPGHFYNGRPEYSRPPRPHPKPGSPEIYKRIDNLPNILPQFRPNAKISSGPHYFDHMSMMKHGYMRQPLLERPSNRPIGFFEKLVPPPPPKNLHNLRKVPMLEHDLRIRNVEDVKSKEQYEFYQHDTPPQPVLSTRRKSDDPTIETLQMIQAKQSEKTEPAKGVSTSAFKTNLQGKDTTEKPLHVVYPIKSAPIKLDALDSNKKETVVVGTRAELPLPPSKINQEFNYESPKDRNDSPILKPHAKPVNFNMKNDFPYPLERPDAPTASDLHIGNNLDTKEDSKFAANNQWGALRDTEPRIVTGSKINYKNPNQISVTLKTYTEKPIAIAYTPTEPYKKLENTEKYSMPNYASPVISEIRPGLLEKGASEITVSAIMHTHPQAADIGPQSISSSYQSKPLLDRNTYIDNHKVETDETLTKLEFQAPFQASLNIDGISQGWTVVRNGEKNKIDRSDQETETTTIMPAATTKEFDIENFKPQLFGGFKPIYNYPEEGSKAEETEPVNREERTT